MIAKVEIVLEIVSESETIPPELLADVDQDKNHKAILIIYAQDTPFYTQPSTFKCYLL